MSGMGSGVGTNNPTVVSAFDSELLRQGLLVLVILAVVAVAWNVLRTVQIQRARRDNAWQAGSPQQSPEPPARRLLRIGFGLVWVFDGILQGQSSMPLGMVPQVLQPAASGSPDWVQRLVADGARLWSYHPVAVPAAAVWIQVGIGVWLLVAPRGGWSRWAGIATVAWGLIVWSAGEAFGGIFAPGLSWMFGAPGAVLFYCVAGVLIALPDRAWHSPRPGRVVLSAMGLFFVGMAVLQAWPGRGFWQGQPTPHATPGSLTSMVQQMAQTPQPHVLSSLVSDFGGFDAAHGWAVNLFVVVTLGSVGLALLSRRHTILTAGVVAAAVICAADWIFVQDLGFLGGVGTDPNSMIPMTLVVAAGYLAVTRVAPAPAAADEPVAAETETRASWRDRMTADPVRSLRAIAAAGAVGVTLIGAAPMAAAAVEPNADPILTQAINGTPNATDTSAPAFDLTDQRGQAVTLESLRGKTIGLTFLDPVCTSDCPVIAQEFRAADTMLGSQARNIELIAIDANPSDLQPEFLRAFDSQEGLDRLHNWLYLTGSLGQLQNVWNAYGVEVSSEPGGAMIAHSDIAYVIDPRGHTRYVLDADPGPASAATESSFAVTLTDALRNASARP